MSLIRAFFEQRSHPSQPSDGLLKMLGGQPTASGVNVTPQSALAITTVFACIRVLSETSAMLPLVLYERLGQKGKKRATNHPLYPLLHDLPNPEMTAIELRETIMGHVCGWGNGYMEIEWGNNGYPAALWPLRPDKVEVKRQNGQLVYVVSLPTGGRVGLPFDRVMHIKGIGYDGIIGYSPISLHRQAVGLALATEEFGARLFGNGARPGIVLEHPGVLSPQAQENLKNSWTMKHEGLKNAHRVGILEEGMKIHEIGIPPEDAQFIETRKFQVSEIARMYRVPPHMVGDLEHATFSNIEHQGIEFVTFTLGPWLVRAEQAISRDLLTPRERQRYFAEHLVLALLRGDVKSRYEAYIMARDRGIMNANEIRALENMNPQPGQQGETYLVPLNMIPADTLQEANSDPQQARQLIIERRAIEHRARSGNLIKYRQRLAQKIKGLLGKAIGRVISRETKAVRAAIKKYLGQRSGADDFSQWLLDYYKNQRELWVSQLLPLLLRYADQVGGSVADEVGGEALGQDDILEFIEYYTNSLTAEESNSSRLQLQRLLDDALAEGVDPEPLLTERLDGWQGNRAEVLASNQAISALGAFVRNFYIASGVTRMQWVAQGSDTCPYCRDMDGKIVGVRDTFLDKDTNFQPDDADRPLKRRKNVRSPGLHGGCDCQILAVT